MILQSPSDVAFYMFNFPIYFYGIILAFSILVGVYTAYLLFKKFYDSDKANFIIDISPFVIIFGILGARLYYCLMNYPYYAKHLSQIFYIREGGQSIHGMIIMGSIGLICFSKIYKISSAKIFDVFLCGTALAQSIGRWGNFFNSEAFGTPYNGFLKLYIPPASRPPEYINNDYFHPTFLYESILDFVIFIILYSCFKKFSKTPGLISALYLIMYGIVRLIIEQIRIDSALNINGIPIAQIASIVLIIAGLAIIPLVLKKHSTN